MRMTLCALCIGLAFSNVAAMAGEPPSIKLEHPKDATLSEDAPGKFVYKSFPSQMRLYVFDKDVPGKSNCNGGCDSAWPPLLVSADEHGSRIGDWTIIRRENGPRQWAYRDRPVYTRYHDIGPDASTEKEGFHLLIP